MNACPAPTRSPAARLRPEIVECFAMSGDSDYLLRIVVNSVAGYDRLLKRTLQHLPGLALINSSYALSAVNITTRLPLDE